MIQPPDGGRLTRARLAAAALALIDEDGPEGLSMRVLADRLGVKAASIYWHVRDRRELLELVAEALLEEAAPPTRAAGWRAGALEAVARLRKVVEHHPKAARVLLEVPGPLRASAAMARLAALLEQGGLPRGEAAPVAEMLLTHTVASPSAASTARPLPSGTPAELAVDSGSRGVEVRADPGIAGLAEAGRDSAATSPAVVRGDRVVVRRLRGVGRGAVLLNPRHAWSIRVQGPTWNTLLDLRGLDVRGVHLDSGATRVEILLPPPRGEVLVEVSGGTAGTRIRRPPGVAATADISPGSVQVRLDEFKLTASTADLHWESRRVPSADRYHVRIAGGSVRVTLEEDPALDATAPPAPAPLDASGRSAVEVVLDGIEAANSKRDG